MTNPPTTTQTQHLAGGPAAPHDPTENLSPISAYLEAAEVIVSKSPRLNKVERKSLKSLRELVTIEATLAVMGHRVDWLDPSLGSQHEAAALAIHKLARETAYYLAQYDRYGSRFCQVESKNCGCLGCVQARDTKGQIITVEMVRNQGARR